MVLPHVAKLDALLVTLVHKDQKESKLVLAHQVIKIF